MHLLSRYKVAISKTNRFQLGSFDLDLNLRSEVDFDLDLRRGVDFDLTLTLEVESTLT